MSNISFANNQDTDYIYRKLMENNKRVCDLKENEKWEEKIELVLRSENDEVMGGIICDQFIGVIYIDMLWVDEEFRGMGIGSNLLREVERLGKERKCKLIYVNTLNVQAPDFYIKNGFETFYILDGFNNGITSYFLKKNI